MRNENVLNCSFSQWYGTFKAVTFESEIISAPQSFIDYLKLDECLDEPGIAEKYGFADFEKDIGDAILRLGGAVFPKLNWSSARDAAWITYNKTLSCENPSDVYRLLKSSQRIDHDLSAPFERSIDRFVGPRDVPYELVLRTYIDVNPAGEYRCFVRERKLVGISQRYTQQYLEFLHSELGEIVKDIVDFHSKSIENRFPDSDFVFDVYRAGPRSVNLVDVGTFGGMTDSCLFTWEDLRSFDPSGNKVKFPVIKVVESGDEKGDGPPPLAANSYPSDFTALAALGCDPYNHSDILRVFRDSDSTSSEDGEQEKS